MDNLVGGFMGGWKAIKASEGFRGRTLKRHGNKSCGEDGKGRDRSWKKFRVTRYK